MSAKMIQLSVIVELVSLKEILTTSGVQSCGCQVLSRGRVDSKHAIVNLLSHKRRLRLVIEGEDDVAVLVDGHTFVLFMQESASLIHRIQLVFLNDRLSIFADKRCPLIHARHLVSITGLHSS